MIEVDDRISKHNMVRATAHTRYLFPFFAHYVQTGFPSPTDNYIEKVCDLNELCITNPEATYFVRVGSDSMIGDRIERGDVLVVDCSREPVEGKIVMVWLNSDHAVKRIHYAGELVGRGGLPRRLSTRPGWTCR